MKEIFENRQVGRGFEFLRKVDIFGVPIQINFNNESKHTTKIGGIVSLAIFGLLISYLINLILQIQDRSNPQVIQEDLIVNNPAQYNLTDQNFGFALALTDEKYEPFIDETYYTVTATFFQKISEVMPDGTHNSVFQKKVIDLEPCTSSSFQVQGTEKFFLSQEYQHLYCIKDLNQLFLVGQFDQPDFSSIQIYFNICSGAHCQSPSEIQRKLQSSSLEVYYTNNVVRISNIQNPFQPIGSSLFWQTNLNQAQVINLTYKNTYVLDDVGLFTSDYETKSNLVFSDSRTMYETNADAYVYYVSIFLEKNRETQYTRKFLKLTQAFSQVGGIYNVLFLLGCILAQPYSYLELERKLVNSTFSFSSEIANASEDKSTNDSKKSKMKKKTDSQSKDKKFEINKNTFSPVMSNQSDLPSQISPLKNNSHSPVTLPFSKKENIIEREKKQTGLSELQNQNQDQRTVNPFESVVNRASNQLTTTFSELKLKTREYFYYYLRCFKLFNSDVKRAMNFGTQKIFEFTDICYIVNKLIELEKMKHLLLNEQQLKLFEYIPKPKVTKSIIEGYHSAVDQNQQITRVIKQNSLIQLNQLVENNQQVNDQPSQLNILTIMNRSSLEKAREAQKAYNNIYKQQNHLSMIDQKLLKLLDENHLPLFNANLFDSSALLNLKQQISKINLSQYQDNQAQKSNPLLENQKENENCHQTSQPKLLPQENIDSDQQQSIIEELLNVDKIKSQDIHSPPSLAEYLSQPQMSMEEFTLSKSVNNNFNLNQQVIDSQYDFQQKNVNKSPFKQFKQQS